MNPNQIVAQACAKAARAFEEDLLASAMGGSGSTYTNPSPESTLTVEKLTAAMKHLAHRQELFKKFAVIIQQAIDKGFNVYDGPESERDVVLISNKMAKSLEIRKADCAEMGSNFHIEPWLEDNIYLVKNTLAEFDKQMRSNVFKKYGVRT